MAWTTPADLKRQLQRKWETGAYLTMLAEGLAWEPLALGVRGPTAAELVARFTEARAWAEQWSRVDPAHMRVEHKRVGRQFGVNAVPAKIWIDDYDQLWRLLGVRKQVALFRELLDATSAESPRLTSWMTANPRTVLEFADCWPELHATVRWIDGRARPGTYLRHIDVPGVDTKFIERHRQVLTALLDHQLPADRIDLAAPRTDFEARFRFQKKPRYARFRLLGGEAIAGFTELTVRVDEFTSAPPGVETVYVVENEITYLAFPPVPRAMVILGGGYAVSILSALPWLAGLDLLYWGDADTHGFAILNRLRARFPHVSSMLMDHQTVLDHRVHWVQEPRPVDTQLDLLTPAEHKLYRDLADHSLGDAVRLEQERIRFSALSQALKTWRT